MHRDKLIFDNFCALAWCVPCRAMMQGGAGPHPAILRNTFPGEIEFARRLDVVQAFGEVHGADAGFIFQLLECDNELVRGAAFGEGRVETALLQFRQHVVGVERGKFGDTLHPGPPPGPPPPGGVEKVLCKFTWMTSKPMSPGFTLPRMAFRFAPS